MATGKVRWFSLEKGYGFIQPDQGVSDIFVHINSLKKSGIDTLTPNQPVSYELAEHNGKRSAVDLKFI